MTPLIAIEGIDGSGKGTQAKVLTDRLAAAGRRVELLSFPRYRETLFGQAIGDFLNGRFGQLNEVHPFLAAVLYAADRYESKSTLFNALDRNEAVICDRFVPSNLAHQGAKLSGTEREELLQTIQRIEFEIFGLPQPQLVILLDIPVEFAQRNIAAKKPRDYTDKAADLQEADADYLQRVRDVYLQLAAENAHWHRVDSVRDGQQRSVSDIAEEIFDRVARDLPANVP